ncbi:hypothetical protein GGD63_006317 [Bradyrhizobium sp. cir1]|uniref:hypothetical protein n=1 Tax=Bradyrhizobium sp. cir1 TaxID=1445730 RepID=UPI0016064F6B|nr:hypothetical protein [Bradyrhizobium sp. cir1]MBB4373494.1 hypothetical protein [Bradyrhizobium sp. cir1]
MTEPVSKTASYTFTNWRRAKDDVPAQEIVEATLFTDTWVTGEIPDLGPYSFINTIAHASDQPGRVLRPAVVMRMSHHYQPSADPAYRTPMENDFEHYHGGDYLDEMAALASLFLGRRLKAGGVNREFRGEDRFGRPSQFSGKPDPHLMLEGRTQIPRLALPVNLNAGLPALSTFPDRTVEQTNALIKAARQYQQAVWIADSDPSLAWLMLVSAIETAVQEWSGKATPVEQLELAFPELVKLIQESSSPELLEPMADILKQLTRSTKRFVDFMQSFPPPPPGTRPEEWMQFSYDPSNMKKVFSLIYGHRSMSLHRGTVFPLPMCEAPRFGRQGDESVTVHERPFGLATTSRNASWKIEKTPMLLNTFEHLVRGALLNWWASLDQVGDLDPLGCEPSQPN